MLSAFLDVRTADVNPLIPADYDIIWSSVIFVALLIVVAVFVVRPLTAWISLLRRLPLGDPRIGVRERRVVAFFGVRGVGTLYYLAYALDKADFAGAEQLWRVTVLVVLGSVVVHGIAATPVMARLDRRREKAAVELHGTADAAPTTAV